jgi:hypothetical protein
MVRDAKPNPPDPVAHTRYDRPGGCLLRLFWMAFGNLALVLIALVIIERRDFSAVDVAYWLVVVALVIARYVDIARFAGRTASDEPATLRHFRRYALGLLASAAALWTCVHVLNYLL